MRNTKIYSILKEFDKYEQNRCRKFLQSPYFNRDQTLVALFNFLIDQVNTQSELEISKEEIWQALKLEECYDDVRFRKYTSDLLKLVEDYLIQSHFESSPLNRSTFLLGAISKRKITPLYNSALRNAQILLEKEAFRSAHFFYHQYIKEKHYYEMLEFDIKRSLRSNIEDISDNLDFFYLSEKLKYYCEILSRQRVASYDYKISLINEIVGFLNSNSLEHIPPIAIYYQIYLTLSDADAEENYFKLKNYILKYINQFEKSEAQQIYAFAQNYCISKCNRGNSHFWKELFDIYVNSLENNVIDADGELAPWHFKNIVGIALRLKEFDWTENFINSYQHKLPSSFKNNAVTYNLAHVYYYQKKYNKVLELLQAVEYEDIFYTLDSKSMLLTTYYELGEIEPLYFLFESFSALLNRNKQIPESRRKNYKNLIRFTKKLSKITPGDQKTIQKIKEELETTKNVTHHAWLMEKIAELES